MSDSRRLDDRVAIVTGAAQGIGKGIALVLAGAGAKIVIGDIQDASGTVDEIRSEGGTASSMIMDTSSADQARALVDMALGPFSETVVFDAGTPLTDRRRILEQLLQDDELMFCHTGSPEIGCIGAQVRNLPITGGDGDAGDGDALTHPTLIDMIDCSAGVRPLLSRVLGEVLIIRRESSS